MQVYSWKSEFTRLMALVMVGAVASWLFNLGNWPIIILLALYILWSLRQLHHVNAWLTSRRNEAPPESRGLWGQVLDQAYALQREGVRDRDRLQSLVDYQRDSFASMADAVVMLDGRANIEWCNTASATLLNLRPSLDVDAHITNLLRNPEFIHYFEAEDYRSPLEIDSPANRHIKLSISISFFGKRSRLLFARDVTRTHQLEEMRRGFVANVSHELRTPLTVILSYLESLSTQPMPDTRWEKAFAQMTAHSQRMQQLVEDLMSLSRLEDAPQTTSWEWVDVAALLTTLRDEMAAMASGTRHVEIDCDEALQLFGNPTELRSAFSNLAVNAARYSEAGDRIVLRWHQTADRAVFAVEDSGIGIDPGHIPRLTERFYRVDPSRSSATGGTGLGLAIVKHVLMRHRADLEVQSQVGHGSTFSCRFPLAATRRLAKQPAEDC